MLYKIGYEVSSACTDKQQDCYDCEVTDCGDLDKTFYAYSDPICNDHHFDGQCDRDIDDH
jgi:hypothetical protein